MSLRADLREEIADTLRQALKKYPVPVGLGRCLEVADALLPLLTREIARETQEDRAAICGLEAVLGRCSVLFTSIRGDWIDPRHECREGQKAIGEALDAHESALARARREEPAP